MLCPITIRSKASDEQHRIASAGATADDTCNPPWANSNERVSARLRSFAMDSTLFRVCGLGIWTTESNSDVRCATGTTSNLDLRFELTDRIAGTFFQPDLKVRPWFRYGENL